MNSSRSINRIWTTPPPHLIYNWRTSIPDRWLRIKGEEYFQSVKEAKRPSNTLQFLQETQKYISKIRQMESRDSFRKPDRTERRLSLRPIETAKPPKLPSGMPSLRSNRSAGELGPHLHKGSTSALAKRIPLKFKLSERPPMKRLRKRISPPTAYLIEGKESRLH